MKLVSNVVLGVMFLTAVLGLMVIIGSIVVGEFEFSSIKSIHLNGDLGGSDRVRILKYKDVQK